MRHAVPLRFTARRCKSLRSLATWAALAPNGASLAHAYNHPRLRRLPVNVEGQHR